MTNNIEFTGKKYDQDFTSAAWGWDSYRRREEASLTKLAAAYVLFFDEINYKVSVWKWKKFYHEKVKQQHGHKKNHEQSIISNKRVMLRFLLELRKYGKEQYKINKTLVKPTEETIV